MRTRHLPNLKNHWQQVVNASVDMGKAQSPSGRPGPGTADLPGNNAGPDSDHWVVTLTGWAVNVTITSRCAAYLR